MNITNILAQTYTITGTVINDENKQPLKNIKVGLKDLEIYTISDNLGNFQMEVPDSITVIKFSSFENKIVNEIKILSPNNYQIYLIDIGNIFDLSISELMDVPVRIGTRGKERALFESPVPIDIITANDIKNTGLHELTSVLQRMIPAINSTRPSINDGTDHSYPFTLNGLGPDQILVLINGKRLHNTSLINLNNSIGKGSTHIDLNIIPVSAVERIEILRDGSAAQYGSDAISGIINIVLKSNFENSTSVKYQQCLEGDGIVKQFNNLVGVKLKNDGFIHLTTEIRERQATNRSGVYRAEDSLLKGENLQLLDKQIYKHGDAFARDISFVSNSEIPIQSNFMFYFSSLYNFRHGISGVMYRLPSQNVLTEKYPSGFLPEITPNINDLSATIGIKSKNNDWNWNFSATYGSNSFEFNVENSCNVSLGPTSPSTFYCGTLGSSQTILNLDLFRNLDCGWKNPLKIGFGSELKLENYYIKAGEEKSYIDGMYYKDTIPNTTTPNYAPYAKPGAQGFPGFMPENQINKYRNNIALYIDLEQNLSKQLLISTAARYENFSDFGETSNGKISFHYAPIQKLIFRGSASTGFRAPSLAQSHFTSTATTYIRNIPYQVGTFSVEHPLSKALGAQSLKPEKSINTTIGSVIQFKNLSFSFDYFYTEIVDRIVLSGTYTIANSSDSISKLLKKHNVDGARFFTNAVDTRTYGFDAMIKYKITSAFGIFTFSISNNYNKTRIVGNIKYPSIIATEEKTKEIFFDIIEKSRIETVQPNFNSRFGLNYNYKKIAINLYAMYFGDYTIINTASLQSQNYSGKTLTDLNISYRYNKIELLLGGHNIFNVYPDKMNYAYKPDGKLANITSGYIIRYSALSPFGFNGADYYSRIIFYF